MNEHDYDLSYLAFDHRTGSLLMEIYLKEYIFTFNREESDFIVYFKNENEIRVDLKTKKAEMNYKNFEKKKIIKKLIKRKLRELNDKNNKEHKLFNCLIPPSIKLRITDDIKKEIKLENGKYSFEPVEQRMKIMFRNADFIYLYVSDLCKLINNINNYIEKR